MLLLIMLSGKLFLQVAKVFSLSSKYCDIIKQDHHILFSRKENKKNIIKFLHQVLIFI